MWSRCDCSWPRQAEFALILEDDVLLHDSLPAVLHGLLRHAERWDMVKLSAVHSGTPPAGAGGGAGSPAGRDAAAAARAPAPISLNRRAAQAYV